MLKNLMLETKLHYQSFTESQQEMEKTTLRKIVNDTDIRKITLLGKPQILDSLVQQLEVLDLQYKFSLQYEDPEFNNALINLTDIADLSDKATLKIITLVPAATLSSPSSPSTSTADRDSPFFLSKTVPMARDL